MAVQTATGSPVIQMLGAANQLFHEENAKTAAALEKLIVKMQGLLETTIKENAALREQIVQLESQKKQSEAALTANLEELKKLIQQRAVLAETRILGVESQAHDKIKALQAKVDALQKALELETKTTSGLSGSVTQLTTKSNAMEKTHSEQITAINARITGVEKSLSVQMTAVKKLVADLTTKHNTHFHPMVHAGKPWLPAANKMRLFYAAPHYFS